MSQINLIYERLRAESSITDEAILRSLIDYDLNSEEKKRKIDGTNYYNNQNTAILEKKSKEFKIIKEHRVPTGFYKEIVDQIVSYCVGKEIIIENLNDDKILDINDFIYDLYLEARKKGISWLYMYIDRKGNLNYKIIDSIEIIPIYDTEFEDELLQIIRYYKMLVVENDQEYFRYKVEVYDKEKVSYYMENEKGEFYFDLAIQSNPIFYNSNKFMSLGKTSRIENFGWGAVPFIPLRNNKQDLYDLQVIKGHIDLFDELISGFANNIELFQEAILKVKDRGAQDWEEFWLQLKKYGIITCDDVSAVGDIDFLRVDIPYEARECFINIIRDLIYETAQAVDTRKLSEGNITNVVIKSRYANLDLKADAGIRQLKTFIYNLYEFVNIYKKIKNKPLEDVENLKAIFNKKMIFNDSEIIESIVKSDGIISKKTNISNHPYVTNIDDELEQIEEEELQYKDNEPEPDEANELEVV
ncbi:MAG: phage portal protein [Candidatus Paceibacterota bacterium]|jgi:SPP1 family phage portal protein